MTSYPESLDDLTADVDDLGVLATAAWMTPRAVEAVQAELGVTPSAADATVSARLDRMEDDLEQAEMGALPSEIDCGTP